MFISGKKHREEELHMTTEKATITERDRKVINLVARLNDRELFGLECFLAGTRVAKKEEPATKQKAGTATA